MKLIEKIQQLDRLHYLIKRKATGRPKQLAFRLKISERTLYRIIDELKCCDMPIKYNRIKQTYYYTEENIELKLK